MTIQTKKIKSKKNGTVVTVPREFKVKPDEWTDIGNNIDKKNKIKWEYQKDYDELIEKIKKSDIKIEYDYASLTRVKNSSNDWYYDFPFQFYDQFIKRNLNGKLPYETRIGAIDNLHICKFLNDNFENIKFEYIFDSYVMENITHDTDLCWFGIFKYKNMFFRFSSVELHLISTNISEYYENIEMFKKIIADYKIVINTESKIFLILQDRNEFYLKNHQIDEVDVDIDDNYNDDFKNIDLIVKERLMTSTKGLILLHGNMGTGKTNYIRHLINHFDDKKFIFVPSFLSNHISETSFVTFLVQNCQNSVLILEDCENSIKSRSNVAAGNNSISDLLNMTDGLMSDVLKIQFVCTFNANIKDIDEALLRQGRLIAQYYFNDLSFEKSKKLAKKLGKKPLVVNKSYSLAEIYNIDVETPKVGKEKKALGFGK